MPTAPDQKATRRLGGAILLTTALAFAATAIVPRIDFVRPDRYRFEVPLDLGVGTLEVDSRVLLAGLPVGRVTAADPARSDDGRFDVVAVEFAVDPNIRLGTGTAAQLVAPLLGTGTDVRLLPGEGPRLENGAMVRWLPQPDLLESLFGPEQAGRLRRIATDLDRVGEWYDAHDEEIAAFLDAMEEDFERIEAMAGPDLEGWGGSRSSIATNLRVVETASNAIGDSFSRLSEAWKRLLGNFDASKKRFGGVTPVGGGSLEQLELLSATPDFEPIESRATAIEAIWARVRPRWADLVSHFGAIVELVRADLPYALANARLAGNELTGLIDSAESDPIPIAGEALGVLLGLIPSEDRRVAMAKAESLRDYVRAMMELRETLAAIDRVNASAAGSALAVPAELKTRLSKVLADLAAAEQAALRAWAPVR